MKPSLIPFVRSPFTYLAYGMLAYFAYSQSVFGPIMPFLRAELALSYSVAGLHASGFAVGLVLAGWWGDTLAYRWGTRLTFWLGGAGMAFGMLLLSAAPVALVTVSASVVMGSFGGLLLVMIQTGLAEAHPQHRAVAFLEANLLASLSMTALPLTVGATESVGLGWRWALWFMILLWLVAVRLGCKVAFPVAALGEGDKRSGKKPPRAPQIPLPKVFWLYWAVLFLGVAIEWCMTLWTADFLVSQGVSATRAASLLAVFTGAGVVGRWLTSRLARRVSSAHLLIGMLGLVLLGFPVFWQVNMLSLRLLGLCVSGFGVSGFFPLGLATTSEAVPEAPQRASAKASLAAGLAILVNPQLLGVVADAVGIARAFALVLVLLLLALGLALLAVRAQRQDD